MRDKKGVHNSFESSDLVNAIDWRQKTYFPELFYYYKGLISLRKNHPAFRMGDAEKVRRHLKFLPVEGDNLIAFTLNNNANGDSWETILVAFNTRPETARLEIPAGKYTIVCADGQINEAGLARIEGDQIMIPAQSALIMYK